ncbi:2-oxoacid:acceptor oxidoreductase subunit alpha [Candidatus Borrarchaeum sp.]|uniref:2-oxoacid:acceptor oxidoreductase subunit alpha n=1 Tax=Candidatus Borrarchaeum sp. TaxID=2846742 RepID=UPI00257E1730|nr:2-oxoacid:acceptor oxidoreductase subunit alpha [Candidatus Borrarchaeum sp.]
MSTEFSIDLNFRVGGAAGQGVQSIGGILSKTFARGGYHIFTHQDYESRIRGGHSFFHLRLSDKPVYTAPNEVNVLIALDDRTIEIHQDVMVPNSVIICDRQLREVDPEVERIHDIFDVPLMNLAVEAGNKLYVNTVAMGAALGLIEFDFDILTGLITDEFKKKGQTIIDENVKAARSGYEFTQKNYKGTCCYTIKPRTAPKKMVLTSNEAVGLGALFAGCKFVSAYPMTPSTSIWVTMKALAHDDFVFVQTEDELASINMALGAAYGGVRTMTTTSGGGFALMNEGFSLAGATETPIVVALVSRPGPATGLPTRTEQSDLEYVLHAGHGEFPRVIFAPSCQEEAFRLTVKAFNIAEKYHVPVVILQDQHLADSYRSVDPADFSIDEIKIDRGPMAIDEQLKASMDFKTHLVTESGVSPRAFPGTKGIIVATAGDEHDEYGHIIEDAETRNEQLEKRMRKLDALMKEIQEPLIYGPETADISLIGWGSTYGAIREAVDILIEEGIITNMMHATEVFPVHKAVGDFVAKAKRSFVVENNYTGQYANIIRAYTGKLPSGRINKYDGRPFAPENIVEEIKRRMVV